MQNKIIQLPDMFLEVKGIITLIFDAVIRLEQAYQTGNQPERHLRLKLFRQYRQFFNGQVENGNFTISQKIDLYNQLMEVCLKILAHDRDFYAVYPIIKKRTQHYIVRICKRLDTLVNQLAEEQDLINAIKVKEEAINRLKKGRHHYQLIVEGMTHSIENMEKQLEAMQGKLNKLGGK